MSSEGKRWTMRYRRFEDDTSAIPYVADGPEIDVESIEVVPAFEVERLREALREVRALDVNDGLTDAEAFDCVQTIAEAALADERKDER